MRPPSQDLVALIEHGGLAWRDGSLWFSETYHCAAAPRIEDRTGLRGLVSDLDRDLGRVVRAPGRRCS